MANHASARKRIRRNSRRAAINGNRRSRVRTFIKKVDKAIQNGDIQGAEQAFEQAKPELDRSCAKGVFHKNTVARTTSRLSARIKAMKETGT
jgi:small subunit ribosomal protein S20